MWAIGYIDLMGYRRELLATGYKPSDDEDELHRRYTRVFERREILIRPLETYFAELRRRQESRPPDPTRPAMAQYFRAPDVTVTGFSDSVFLEASTSPTRATGGMTDNGLAPLNSVVTASIVALFTNLKAKSPLRGGLDIGFGVRSRGHLYSAATVSAVELGEECAKYPRILVGPSVVKTIQPMTNGTSPESRIARDIENVLYEDPDDGRLGLDFLGSVSQGLYASGFKPSDVRDIWLFAHTNRNTFSDSGVQKEWGYYDRLIRYMEPRLALWGPPRYWEDPRVRRTG